MPTNKTKSTKRRTKIKELPKQRKVLSVGDLKKVKGGVTGPNAKAKTADKALNAMEGYIRG